VSGCSALQSPWPGLTRPSTPSFAWERKTWMPGSSLGMTESMAVDAAYRFFCFGGFGLGAGGVRFAGAAGLFCRAG
jgi:hypothetical protein